MVTYVSALRLKTDGAVGPCWVGRSEYTLNNSTATGVADGETVGLDVAVAVAAGVGVTGGAEGAAEGPEGVGMGEDVQATRAPTSSGTHLRRFTVTLLIGCHRLDTPSLRR
jgi:hypothetical protein